MTCLVTLFDRKFEVFKNSPKLTIFGIFNELLNIQNDARFARNVEWDIFCDFQTLCIFFSYQMVWKITKSPAGTIKSSDPTTHLRLKTIMPGIAWYVLQPRARLLSSLSQQPKQPQLSYLILTFPFSSMTCKGNEFFLLLIRKYYTYSRTSI